MPSKCECITCFHGGSIHHQTHFLFQMIVEKETTVRRQYKMIFSMTSGFFHLGIWSFVQETIEPLWRSGRTCQCGTCVLEFTVKKISPIKLCVRSFCCPLEQALAQFSKAGTDVKNSACIPSTEPILLQAGKWVIVQ